MSAIVVNGDVSGSITLQAPSVAGTNTLTLPTATATLAFNGPAFRAYATGGQSVSNLTFAKVQFNNESFDTANCFDSTTNYRFTPNVAGYYQINGVCAFNGSASGYATVTIYKNGSNINQGASTPNNTTFGGGSNVSDTVYMNGTTDYIELFVAQSSGGSLTLQVGANTNIFSASMVRAA